jgi:hypothetical protein
VRSLTPRIFESSLVKSRGDVFGFLFATLQTPPRVRRYFNVFNVSECTRPPARHRKYHFVTIQKALPKSSLDAAMIQLESRLTNSEISPFELEAEDEDYDVYLFWPSLNTGSATFKKPFVTTHQRVRRLILRAAQDSPEASRD